MKLTVTCVFCGDDLWVRPKNLALNLIDICTFLKLHLYRLKGLTYYKNILKITIYRLKGLKYYILRPVDLLNICLLDICLKGYISLGKVDNSVNV